MDKSSFMNEMRQLIHQANGNKMSENQLMKMDSMLISLYSLFDIDKNGILNANEVAAAMCVLARGAIAKKIKFGIRIFSSTDTKAEVKIRYHEFSKYLHFIFKLSLENKNEIMLDYDLETLAKEVATAAFVFNKLDPKSKDEIHLNQIMNFMNKQSSLDM